MYCMQIVWKTFLCYLFSIEQLLENLDLDQLCAENQKLSSKTSVFGAALNLHFLAFLPQLNLLSTSFLLTASGLFESQGVCPAPQTGAILEFNTRRTN